VRLSPLKGELRTEVKRRGLGFARVHDRLPPDSAFASRGVSVLRYKIPFPEFQRMKSFPNQTTTNAPPPPGPSLSGWTLKEGGVTWGVDPASALSRTFLPASPRGGVRTNRCALYGSSYRAMRLF
jgi:hypothetical protein